MSGLFEQYGTEHIEEKPRDFVGFEAHGTDLYKSTIKLAYLATAASGAKAIVFEFDLVTPAGSKPFKVEQYFTDKAGKNTYMTKPKTAGEKPKSASLPGFVIVDDICTVATGKGLQKQSAEVKKLNVYNSELKRDVPTDVHVLTDLIGKEVGVAVWKTLENKSVKVDGVYVPTSEEISKNEIEKIVFPATGKTVVEHNEGKDPVWATKWVNKNRGQVKKKLTFQGGGSSGGGSSVPPADDRKPLFG